MSVSIKKSFGNIFSDKSFIEKYSNLVILSFACGFLNFVILAKNYSLLIPAIFLAAIAVVFNFGYDLTYVKSMMVNINSELPLWNGNFKKFFILGLKWIAAILLICFIFDIVLVFFMILVSIFAMLLHYKSVVLMMPKILFIVSEIFAIIFMQGLIYLFLDSNEAIASLFNLKKLFSYFSVNYFTSVAGTSIFILFNAILSTLATIKLEYALWYIVPLLIAPLFKLVNDNLMAQAYVANKNNEKTSWTILVLYLIMAILLCILLLYLMFTFGLIKHH